MISWNRPYLAAREAFIGSDTEWTRYHFSEYWRNKLAYEAAGERVEWKQRVAQCWPSTSNRQHMLNEIRNCERWLKASIFHITYIKEIFKCSKSMSF